VHLIPLFCIFKGNNKKSVFQYNTPSDSVVHMWENFLYVNNELFSIWLKDHVFLRKSGLKLWCFGRMTTLSSLKRSNLLRNLSWYKNVCNRCSSVSIVSGYGLDTRAIEVRSPAGAKDFSSNLCVWTGSGAHSASCPVGTGRPFPGGKARPGRDADHSPHLVPMSWMSRSCTSPPPQAPPWRVAVLFYLWKRIGNTKKT
jgi:hypothetical protein